MGSAVGVCLFRWWWALGVRGCSLGSLGWPVGWFRLRVGTRVDESGAGGVSLDRVAWPDRCDEMIIVGCALVDPAMWPVVVVVIDVLDE